MSKFLFLVSLAVLTACSLTACTLAGQQRGVVDGRYVSTTRPAISVGIQNSLPLTAAGRGNAYLKEDAPIGGLPIDIWIATYGNAQKKAMAVIAQAEVPPNWFWDGDMRRPLSINERVEVIDGQAFQACTFTENISRSPFGRIASSATDSGPEVWVVRAFATRFNGDRDKIILEYREPLPTGITDIGTMPYGMGGFIAEFEERARKIFSIGLPPKEVIIPQTFAQGIQWQYMGKKFLGTASRNERLYFD
ncbi:MAG: DUF4851 domain-containing protein [Desulfovibrio sp.]|nr:DUF4851 domain-containing protein [Desulfovibrio sp.]